MNSTLHTGSGATDSSVLLPANSSIEQVIRIEENQLDLLIGVLEEKGFQVVGPVLRDSAILFDRIRGSDQLPKGWTDEQTNATYRLKKGQGRWFGYSSTPASWKQFLFPPWLKLFKAERNQHLIEVRGAEHESHRYAFLGIHPCDLEAINVQDKIFIHGGYSDPYYEETRKNLFTVVVACTTPDGTCFCASMESGPSAAKGFDLQLTEILSNEDHYFLAEAGSEQGSGLLSRIPHRPASASELAEGKAQLNTATRSMGRSMDTAGLKEQLMGQITDPQWEAIGQRCLACSNCTLVCPTCFCSTVEDMTDLTGANAERVRRWDSCFTGEFSYIHGGSVRSTIHARYRQWLMHKLSFWVDQFGTFGCVGCGRCITWCPAGIDLTEEAAKLRQRGQNHESKSTL